MAEGHFRLALAGVIGTAAAATLGVMRHEVTRSVKWAATPITRRMPWNKSDKNTRNDNRANDPHELISQLSIVDIFIFDKDGHFGKYKKMSHYIVNAVELSGYNEGVTAAGYAREFSTFLGTITNIKTEHGFDICHIDFGNIYPQGYSFTNVFEAHLYDSFVDKEERWTQEIAFPTKHLTIRIHFPYDRKPKTLKCKSMDGLTTKQLKTEATIADMKNGSCVVWEIAYPQLKDVFELEWLW
jgi:hypothetical protein